MARGGRRGGAGGGRRHSINNKFDSLVRSNRARPLELLAPNRGKEVVDRRRAEERHTLMARFGVGDDMPHVQSRINLPHLPRLQALNHVSTSKPRVVDRSLRRTNDPQHATTLVMPPEPEQWLIDIMYPKRAQRSPSPAVSPFEEHFLAQEQIPPLIGAHPQAHAQVTQGPAPPPEQPAAIVPANAVQPPFTLLPQISIQGPAEWPDPTVNPAANAMAAPRPVVPLWLTSHGVVDVAGRPVLLPSAFHPSMRPNERRVRDYSYTSRYSAPRRRRRRRITSYSPDSDDYDDDREYDEYEYETRLYQRAHSGRRERSRRRHSPASEDREDEFEYDEHAPPRQKLQRTASQSPGNYGDNYDNYGNFGEGYNRIDSLREDSNEELPSEQLAVSRAPNKFSNCSPRGQDLGVRARSANAPTPSIPAAPVKLGKSCDDKALSQLSPLQCATRNAGALIQLPTPPLLSSSIRPTCPEDTPSSLWGPRLMETLERAVEDMSDDDMMSVADENSSPRLEATYPPTPATTAPLPPAQAQSVPSNHTAHSSDADGKSSARMQRATERAWAALAAMQPRHEQQDPVASEMPAPPSPALGPVDAEVTDDEEIIDDIEEIESIYQFSDDGGIEAEIPQFDLSWEGEEKIESVAPYAKSYPKSIMSGTGKATPKHVRFAWDIGGVGESDPGFKIWRDGY